MEEKAKRRMRSKAERRQIVEETFKNGASVAQIARAHGVNANQVFNWRRLYQTQVYLHADMKLKEQALARTTSSGIAPRRFRPSDPLLAFLEAL